MLFIIVLDEQVIQSRRDGSENFYRNWTEYELGFGSPASEVWLGIHRIFPFLLLNLVLLQIT